MLAVHSGPSARIQIKKFLDELKAPLSTKELRRIHREYSKDLHLATTALIRARQAYKELQVDAFQVQSLRIVHAMRIKLALRECRGALRQIEKSRKLEKLGGAIEGVPNELDKAVSRLRLLERGIYRRLREKAPECFSSVSKNKEGNDPATSTIPPVQDRPIVTSTLQSKDEGRNQPLPSFQDALSVLEGAPSQPSPDLINAATFVPAVQLPILGSLNLQRYLEGAKQIAALIIAATIGFFGGKLANNRGQSNQDGDSHTKQSGLTHGALNKVTSCNSPAANVALSSSGSLVLPRFAPNESAIAAINNDTNATYNLGLPNFEFENPILLASLSSTQLRAASSLSAAGRAIFPLESPPSSSLPTKSSFVGLSTNNVKSTNTTEVPSPSKKYVYISTNITQRLKDPKILPFERLVLKGVFEQFKSNGDEKGEHYYIGAYHPGCLDELHPLARSQYSLEQANALNKKLSEISKEEFHAIWLKKEVREEYIKKILLELRTPSSPVPPAQPPAEKKVPVIINQIPPEFSLTAMANLATSQSETKASVPATTLFDRRMAEIMRYVNQHNEDSTQDTYLLFIPPPAGRAHTHSPLELPRKEYSREDLDRILKLINSLDEQTREGMFHTPESLRAFLVAQTPRASTPALSNSLTPESQLASATLLSLPVTLRQDLHRERILFSTHSHLQGVGGAVELSAPHQEFFPHAGVSFLVAEDKEAQVVGRGDFDMQNGNFTGRLRSEASYSGQFSVLGHLLYASPTTQLGGDMSVAVERSQHTDLHDESEPANSSDLASQISLGMTVLEASSTFSTGVLIRDESPGLYLNTGYRWRGGTHHLTVGGYSTLASYGAHLAYTRVFLGNELQVSYQLDSGNHKLSGDYMHSFGALSLKGELAFRSADQAAPHFNGRLEDPFLDLEEVTLSGSLSPWLRVNRRWALTSLIQATSQGDVRLRAGLLFTSVEPSKYSLHLELGKDYPNESEGYWAGRVSVAVGF